MTHTTPIEDAEEIFDDIMRRVEKQIEKGVCPCCLVRIHTAVILHMLEDRMGRDSIGYFAAIAKELSTLKRGEVH